MVNVELLAQESSALLGVAIYRQPFQMMGLHGYVAM